MAARPKFTRVPKTTALVEAGVPAEVIPTYCCLADYANNKTGLCWPKMETLAKTLHRSVRTVQRHLHLLRECGLIEFVDRRRHKGRFSSYIYKICFIPTTGHGRRMVKGAPNKRRTKRTTNTPYNPPKEAFNWFFGKPRDLQAEQLHHTQQKRERDQTSRRTKEGYEWFFE